MSGIMENSVAGKVLRIVAERPGMTAGEMAVLLEVKQCNVSSSITRLLKKGLLRVMAEKKYRFQRYEIIPVVERSKKVPGIPAGPPVYRGLAYWGQ